MEVMEFKNGCTVTVPDNVTAIFGSNAEESGRIEGFVKGDQATVGDITLHMVEKIYNDLDDEQRSQFIHAFVEIVQSKLPKNMQINSITVRKGAKPEDDND